MDRTGTFRFLRTGRNVEMQRFLLQPAGRDLRYPAFRIVRYRNRQIDIGQDIEIQFASVRTEFVSGFRQHDGIFLHLRDRNRFREVIGLVGKDDFSRTAVILVVGSDDEIVRMRRHGACGRFGYPFRFGHLHRIIDIAVQFDFDRFAGGRHGIRLLGQHQCGIGSLLVNLHLFVPEAAAQEDTPLAHRQLLIGCDAEYEPRGLQGAGTDIRNPFGTLLTDFIVEIDIRLQFDHDLAGAGPHLELR